MPPERPWLLEWDQFPDRDPDDAGTNDDQRLLKLLRLHEQHDRDEGNQDRRQIVECSASEDETGTGDGARCGSAHSIHESFDALVLGKPPKIGSGNDGKEVARAKGGEGSD